ncbi:MAG: NYN domain-containing protein, partial [Anaerolineae bacterium]|nr:NYN domain-containing protein [Anaerolineae bacterium]
MSSYLIVDVDDLLDYLQGQTAAPKLMDAATTLRSTAALAAGLSSPERLQAIAIAEWNKYRRADSNGVNVQQVFVSTGYDLFNVSERRYVTDALLTQYFPIDAEDQVDELILASANPDVTAIISRIQFAPNSRIRIWADARPQLQNVIFQPLQSIVGVQNKTVALYIDFENITISLNEQDYIVDVDMLIEGLKRRAQYYGQVVNIAAYAPWGQRGSLPPMLDTQGREISEDIPSRLALESIDPVYSLPGKNSADLRIAKDVLAESLGPDSPDIIIIASGDRDFNNIYNTLRARGKQIVVWGVRGSTSRVLEHNTAITLEYVDDFVRFRQHKELQDLFKQPTPDTDSIEEEVVDAFRPSQWSSVVLQYDFLVANRAPRNLTSAVLAERLAENNITNSTDRALELIDQAVKVGILQQDRRNKGLVLNPEHPVVRQTRVIRDRIV